MRLRGSARTFKRGFRWSHGDRNQRSEHSEPAARRGRGTMYLLRRLRRFRLLGVAACLATGVSLAGATASGSEPGANAVTVWNANAGEAAIAACSLGGHAPLEARMYAMTHAAIHDALN